MAEETLHILLQAVDSIFQTPKMVKDITELILQQTAAIDQMAGSMHVLSKAASELAQGHQRIGEFIEIMSILSANLESLSAVS